MYLSGYVYVNTRKISFLKHTSPTCLFLAFSKHHQATYNIKQVIKLLTSRYETQKFINKLLDSGEKTSY